ncbi:hypothetical protein SPRG_20275 [Saprolegnia parasitica CBS 223.65]|uniref:PH domain-containing protein n=1 Tax=Saprolegnia parasitica (strain CBS 223.65) TaxID=695850 RepID=A0A067CCA3_SAPPC|nr:hypothetical protein SPRG_20275 [Saprolegnia parasitica CBS 223.65]KDO28118.1 hypothetical protein SPRG_20275 [Saprolegnia parasitica CBS 223.65]|eukprot:XP_012201257.1 hypothetical protein SPRG_20275 [Saprolegnia parasitica CBS 223.65]
MATTTTWEGWVHKHGGLFPSWKKVYLVVRGRQLVYLDREASNPRAKEKAKATLTAVARSTDVKNGLTITGADGKHARIYTKTSEEVTGCLNAMNAALRPEPKPRPSMDGLPATHAGWLGMDAKGPKKWYFVLTGPDLSNYDRIGGAEIGRGRLADIQPAERPTSFAFVFTNGRVLPVAAESAADADAWISAVCSVLNKPKPMAPRHSIDAPLAGRPSSRELDETPVSEPKPVRAPVVVPPRSDLTPVRQPQVQHRVQHEAPVQHHAPTPEPTIAPPIVPEPEVKQPDFTLPPPVSSGGMKPRKFAPAQPPKAPLMKPPRAPQPLAQEAHFANNAAEVWQMTDPSLVQAWVEHGKAAPVSAPMPPPQPTQKLSSFLDKYNVRPEGMAASNAQTSL